MTNLPTIIPAVSTHGQEASRGAVALAAMVLIALAAWVEIDGVRFADPDLFVTLYAGREIDAHGGPPRVDTASFTVAGQPWNDYEWLARLVFFRVADTAGDSGLVVLRLLLVGGILATFLITARRRGGGPVTFAVAVGLFVGAAGGYLLFRPTLFTFLAVAILLAAMERMREGSRVPAWAIPAAMPLWANLHAGFALGVVLLGLVVAEGIVARLVPRLGSLVAPPIALRRSLPCFAATAALSGIHPLGFHVWDAVVGTLGGKFTPALSEWAPLLSLGLLAKWPAYLLMAVLAAAMLVGRRRLTIFDVLVVLSLGAATFQRVRFLPLFSLAAVPILLRTLPEFRTTAAGRLALRLPGSAPAAVRGAGVLLSAVAVVAVWMRSGVPDLRIRKIGYLTPVPAVAFLRDNGISGRILTEYDWGGYVRWKIPGALIFVDGRSDTVYPLSVIEDWGRFVNAVGDWREVPARYRAQVVLLRRDQPVVPLLEKEPGWVGAWVDDTASMFLRDIPENEASIRALREGRWNAPRIGAEDYLGL